MPAWLFLRREAFDFRQIQRIRGAKVPSDDEATAGDYLIERFNALIILPHLSTSALNMASACAGGPGTGPKPMAVSVFSTSGVCRMALMPPLSVARLCGSVLAGAKKPPQDAAVKPGKPCSA